MIIVTVEGSPTCRWWWELSLFVALLMEDENTVFRDHTSFGKIPENYPKIPVEFPPKYPREENDRPFLHDDSRNVDCILMPEIMALVVW